MNRDQWIARWKDKTAGRFALNAEKFRPIVRGEMAKTMELSKEESFGGICNSLSDSAQEFLGAVYDDLAKLLAADLDKLRAEIAELKKGTNGTTRPRQGAGAP